MHPTELSPQTPINENKLGQGRGGEKNPSLPASLHTWRYFHSREHNNLLNDASSSRFYRGGPSKRTCICLLCVPSIRIKKSALESSVCLPASLSAAPLLACLGKRNKQGRREAGQGNSSSASLSLRYFRFPPSSSATPLRQLDFSAV